MTYPLWPDEPLSAVSLGPVRLLLTDREWEALQAVALDDPPAALHMAARLIERQPCRVVIDRG